MLQFMKNLEDQKNEGLIMNDVYVNLRKKYNRELMGLNAKIKSLKPKSPPKLKKTKNKKE